MAASDRVIERIAVHSLATRWRAGTLSAGTLHPGVRAHGRPRPRLKPLPFEDRAWVGCAHGRSIVPHRKPVLSKRFPPLIRAGLLVQQILPSPDHITIEAHCSQRSASCPECGRPSERVHSLYGRTFGGLPWQGRAATLPRLWRELVGMGFAGRPETVQVWAKRRRRNEPGIPANAAGVRAATYQPPSGTRVARLLMADADVLPEPEQGFVAHLLREASGLAEAIAVARWLNKLWRREGEEGLDQVLDAAAET